ncbi:MAG: ATP-binding protein [Xanthomonadaceae bacterium]|nr:ATP-binding protein [Xanthomonadaceae bacterium]
MHITTVRYLTQYIETDLKEKMVFLGGPRQVGKTTLAKSLLENNSDYMSWDDLRDRKLIVKNEFYRDQKILVLDEIHKYRLWRTLVKGTFDKHFPETKILVTGSARLDHFRKGGDSLVGRYHYYRLHPFTLPELSKTCDASLIKNLLKFGGFPEPYTKQNEDHLSRWQREYTSRVVTQDLTDLESVKDVSLLELLVELLFQKISSPLSIKSLQEDLSLSPHTIDRWITLLERVYFCYRIAPYVPKNRIKAIKKTQKLYLWDWSQVPNSGAQFENCVAGHLLKFCHFHEDTKGHRMELRYIADVEGREIDFVVTRDKTPLFAVECKTGEKSLQPSLKYYQDRYKIPKIYQVHLGTKDYGYADRGGRVIPFNKFCLEEKLK